MDTIKELHEKAMDIVEKAYLIKRGGDINKAFLMFEEALEFEAKAAYLFEEKCSEEPSRGYTISSTVSITE